MDNKGKQSANNGSVHKPKDLTKIDPNNMEELLWWSYQFSISPEKLLSIIWKKGNSVTVIRQHLHSPQ
jgi:hypothetical protein